MKKHTHNFFGFLLFIVFFAACSSGSDDNDTSEADSGTVDETIKIEEGECEAATDSEPEFLQRIGCRADFDALASLPLDASIPGARSAKVDMDQYDGDALYFQNSNLYPIHFDFASEHLSGNKGLVTTLAEFNRVEYYMSDRRFVLGAVTYYEASDTWALEISPYDTASADMIERLYNKVKESAYFGPALAFHPTSQLVEAAASSLPADVRIVTTDDLFDKIDYQPLNLGKAIGQLRFMKANDLDSQYVSFQEIVVLDHVPNDISVVSGLITEEFQTPLSHVNVLSQNRGTPNMGLRGAMTNEELRALEGELVELTVGPFEWSVKKATQKEANAFWDAHKPDAVQVPRYDTEVTELRDIEKLVDEEAGLPLKDAIKAAIPAFGGKASHYSVLAKTDGVRSPKAFAVPVYYYDQFMEQNGFKDQVAEMLADDAFNNDAATRAARLEALQDAMEEAPVDSSFEADLIAKIKAEYPGLRVRFRSSTNAEDLDGFTGAGLYTSQSGDPDDPAYPVMDAVRHVWASVWNFRAFEERSYRGIDHDAVGMALLVHHSFPEEEANGVALTANPFDTAGLEPGFYINVQVGDESVVQPDFGVTTEQIIYYYEMANHPATYLSESSLVEEEGATVLSSAQLLELGKQLKAIHDRFSPAYGPQADNTGFYAMDVEFKLDDSFDPSGELLIYLKQARPHPGRGSVE
jgi:hypothetical protein